MICRRGAAPSESSSEDDEDVFTNLSKKHITKQMRTKSEPSSSSETKQTAEKNPSQPQQSFPIVPSTTSSMKRHHIVMSNSRKKKMDALIQELEAEKSGGGLSQRNRGFIPEKRGSYVEPGEEHRTTNLFVGNLSPNTSENEVIHVFRKFGELHSVKIMWPRTQEEVSRNRVSGFICYRYRIDAENAMSACDDRDPFRNGRRLMIRWGKNVLKEESEMQNLVLKVQNSGQESRSTKLNLENAIQVLIPRDSERERFITNVALSVATNGLSTEKRLLDERRNDPEYSFLVPTYHVDATKREEHQFYQWRVHSFRKGEARHIWSEDPFQMISNGRAWIPPKRFGRESSRNDRARRAIDGNLELSESELEEFQDLTRHKLCNSRKAICAAMAFCFEHSGCSTQIGKMLRELLLDTNCSVEIRVSRVYLLSDILFNSQQPGVKNAFRYRDAIEKMAPDVFISLGQHDQSMGRMTRQKLLSAVTSVLSAWTNWSVFDPNFLSELEARFEGQEIKIEEEKQVEIVEEKLSDVEENEVEKKETVTFEARGDWTEVEERKEDSPITVDNGKTETTKEKEDPVHEEFEVEDIDDIDGQPLEDDDLDEEGLRRLKLVHHGTDTDSNNEEEKQIVMIEANIDNAPLHEGEALKNNTL